MKRRDFLVGATATVAATTLPIPAIAFPKPQIQMHPSVPEWRKMMFGDDIRLHSKVGANLYRRLNNMFIDRHPDLFVTAPYSNRTEMRIKPGGSDKVGVTSDRWRHKIYPRGIVHDNGIIGMSRESQIFVVDSIAERMRFRRQKMMEHYKSEVNLAIYIPVALRWVDADLSELHMYQQQPPLEWSDSDWHHWWHHPYAPGRQLSFLSYVAVYHSYFANYRPYTIEDMRREARESFA
jgi:hypothetical protein